jgi:hypothetical protein
MPSTDLPPEQDSDNELLSDGTSRESPQDSPALEAPNGNKGEADSTSAKGSSPQSRSVRPVMRAYASARDLGMSPRKGPEPLQPLATAGQSGATSTDPNHRDDSPVRPKRHRHHSSTAILRTDSHRPALHSKSSSHPDLRALLEDYTQWGPRHTTRVYGPATGPAGGDDGDDDVETTRSARVPAEAAESQQQPAPTKQPDVPAGDADEADEVIEVLGTRKKSRGRAPSASLSNKSSSPRA